MKKKNKRSLFYIHGLSIAFLILFIISFAGQIFTGVHEFNKFLSEHGQKNISLFTYISSGHFLEATFENWESEFLQMAFFVVLTIKLRQQGSSESKKLSDREEVDRKPKSHPNAPWAVIKGGWILIIYKHSLTIALLLLFFISFYLHCLGSWIDNNLKQELDGKATETFFSYLSSSRFWFESFQNWQSEFLSVFALLFLSIYLRQIGSPQSKPVDAPHIETGE